MASKRKKHTGRWVYRSSRGTFSHESGIERDPSDLPGRVYGRLPGSSAGAAWRDVQRQVEKRGPACPATYDKADALRRRQQYDHKISCNVKAVVRAVESAFTGPCKTARKRLRQAMRSCTPV